MRHLSYREVVLPTLGIVKVYRFIVFIVLQFYFVQAQEGCFPFLECNLRDLEARELRVFQPITIEDALIETIHKQLEIKIAEWDVYQQRAIIQQAAGPFDPVLIDQLEHLRTYHLHYLPRGLKTDFHSSLTTNDLNVVKKNRLGTIFSVSSNVSRSDNELYHLLGLLPSRKVATGDATIRVEQALLRGGLGYGLDTQREKAAKRELDAVKYDVLQTMTEKMLDTALSYWAFVGAIKNLKILKKTEERFEDLKAKANRLIAEKEMAAADILYIEAQISQTRQARIAAEFNLYLAMKQLLFAMGAMDEDLDIDDCLFDHVVEVFPDYPEPIADIACLSQFANRLAQYALITRFDIRAALVREEVAAILLKGFCNETLPQVNAFGQVRKSDFKLGSNAKHLDSALYMKKPQIDVSVGVSVSFPFFNDAALGAYRQQKAIYKQSILATNFIKERVLRDVLTSIRNHFDLVRQIQQANLAVKEYEQIIQNELEKLSAGFGSLFQLVSYENSLTTALQQQNILYRNYSQNIVNIRFFSGTLLRVENCYDLVVEELTTIPLLPVGPCNQEGDCS